MLLLWQATMHTILPIFSSSFHPPKKKFSGLGSPPFSLIPLEVSGPRKANLPPHPIITEVTRPHAREDQQRYRPGH
jgi:hypothetical protein